jgi:hypothetical protein
MAVASGFEQWSGWRSPGQRRVEGRIGFRDRARHGVAEHVANRVILEEEAAERTLAAH